MSADAETAHQIRGIVARAVTRSSNDTGGTQTTNVEVHRHVERTDVEVLSPFGIVSNPPPGSETVVLAVGGDQGDLVALQAGSPEHRLGGTKPGEAGYHNIKGDRSLARLDGTIEHVSAKRVISKVKTATVEVLEDRIIGKLGEAADAPRFVVRPGYAKLRCGVHWFVVTPAGIFCSVVPVVGPDPEPGV